MSVAFSDAWSTADRMAALATARDLRIAAEARETAWLAALAADPDPYGDGGGSGVLDKGWIVEDVACALRVSSAVAAARLHVAHQLATRFPAAFRALQERRLDLGCATRLVDAAEALPDDALAAIQADVLADAATQTIAQFSARVRRAVLRHDPRAAVEQHETQLAQRRVAFAPVEHGMVELWALLPAAGAVALRSTLQQLADAAAGTDERTADQRRADALCALAAGDGTGGAGGTMRPQVRVTVAASTLLGLDDLPGELDGYGPVTAAAARAIADDPHGTWRRLLTDPAGSLVDVSSSSYRPPAPMRRFVELRDGTCRFPTCRRGATSCELDHVTPWQSGGATTPANLIPLCPRHHHLKHDGRWGVVRQPDGAVSWTSPTGRRWTSPPPDPVADVRPVPAASRCSPTPPIR